MSTGFHQVDLAHRLFLVLTGAALLSSCGGVSAVDTARQTHRRLPHRRLPYQLQWRPKPHRGHLVSVKRRRTSR
jgi:hypothetical protein